MKRRDFLRAATGVAGGSAAAVAAQPVAAGEGSPTETGTPTGTGTGTSTGTGTGTGTGTASGGGGGGTVTVEVGPNNEFVFTPGTDEPLYITPGTTVEWVWQSDTHNIHVDSQPEGASWEGHEPIENTGFTYSHTFETTGKYHYWCVPHKANGMVADLVVNDSGQPPGGNGGGGGDGGGPVNPEEMGVPFQAHYVGIATVLMVLTSIVFTFYTLKYGESPNTSGGNN